MNNIFNLLSNIPLSSNEEIFETITQNDNIKIERIVSYGQTTQKDFWYEQEDDEFVVILEGSAQILYDDGEIFDLKKGDSLYINALQKHQVVYTKNPTIWLAVFIKNPKNSNIKSINSL